MRVEFIPAIVPRELPALVRFDRAVFGERDCFDSAAWREFKAFWMKVEGRKAGCCALAEHTDFQHDRKGTDVPRKNSLYVASTGIAEGFRGIGLGSLMKAWQISYARNHGFQRIVTNTRKSNRRMIAVNKKFGFRVIRVTPGYYADPVEATVVMELRLGGRDSS